MRLRSKLITQDPGGQQTAGFTPKGLMLKLTHFCLWSSITDPQPEWRYPTSGTPPYTAHREVVYIAVVRTATEWTRQPKKGNGSLKGSGEKKNQEKR